VLEFTFLYSPLFTQLSMIAVLGHFLHSPRPHSVELPPSSPAQLDFGKKIHHAVLVTDVPRPFK